MLAAICATDCLEYAYAHTQHGKYRAHPASVAPCQVIVHRDQVSTLAFEGVKVKRQSGREGFAFSRSQFRYTPLV